MRIFIAPGQCVPWSSGTVDHQSFVLGCKLCPERMQRKQRGWGLWSQLQTVKWSFASMRWRANPTLHTFLIKRFRASLLTLVEFLPVPLKRGLLKKNERLNGLKIFNLYRLWTQALACASPQTDKLATCVPLERSITQCRYREGGQENSEIMSILDFPRMSNLIIYTLFCHRVVLTITCLIKWWTAGPSNHGKCIWKV